MKNLRLTSTIVSCLIILPILYAANGNACTSLALKAEDGAIVYGRTMEWGAFDLNSRVSIIPRGTSSVAIPLTESPASLGKPGMVSLVLMRLKRISLLTE